MVSHRGSLAEVCGPHISESVGRVGALLDSPPFKPVKPLWDRQDIQPRPVTAASAEAGAGVEDHMPPDIGQAHAASDQGSAPPQPPLTDTPAFDSLAAFHCASPATQPAPAAGPPSSDAAGSAPTASDSRMNAAELTHKKLKLKRLQLQLAMAQMQKQGVSAPRNRDDSLA